MSLSPGPTYLATCSCNRKPIGTIRTIKRAPGSFVWCGLLTLLASPLLLAQSRSCYAGFEISQDCITERGLEQKAAVYQHKITEAMSTLGVSYKIALRLVNNPIEAGYDASVGDVFTEVVRDDEMRNQSFILNVTEDFLENQPEILYEASSLHEVCHIVNDDLPGYHRNFDNPEVAEEFCVLHAVGEARYTGYLQAYANYQHWDKLTYDTFLEKVKNVTLLPAPSETDDADRIAAEYFRTHADGKEHLLIYNGELTDVTLYSTRNRAWHDTEKIAAVIKTGKRMIFFHNHPIDGGQTAMFPSVEDFAIAGLFSFMVYQQNPRLQVEFRVMLPDREVTSVSYGFKRTAVEEIKKVALEYRSVVHQPDLATIEQKRDRLDAQLALECFNDYLQYVCPVDLSRKDAEVCRTHPQYFLWPSARFFIQYRAR
jgi:hypothetical protein